MAYNANIPQATDRIKDSQPELLGNFTAIATLLDANNGQVNFPSQVATPPVTAVGLYGATPAGATPFPQTAVGALPAPASGEVDIYVNYLAGAKIPMTAAKKAVQGWTYLPSGLILKWGNVTVVGADTIVFPVNAPGDPIPAFQTVFNVQITAVNTVQRLYYVTAVSSTTVNITCTNIAGANSTGAVYYMAIGY